MNLPTGARIYIERRETPGRVRLGLFADSRGLEDTPATQGYRHMLEHFVARHPLSTSQRLERKGLFLEAYTVRDGMGFEIETKVDQLDDALPALISVLQPLKVTEEDLKREAEIILHELALESSAEAARRKIGRTVLGKAGVDIGGAAESFANLTPALLMDLQRQQFSPRRLTVTVTGEVNAGAMESVARTLLGSLKWANAPAPWSPPVADVPLRPASFHGSVIGLKVEGMPNQETASLLATGLWMARLLPRAQFIYDWSTGPGVMAIWSPSPDVRRELQNLSLGDVQWAQLEARMLRENRAEEDQYAYAVWRALVFEEPLVSFRSQAAFNNVDLASVQNALAKWRTGTFLAGESR